MTQPIHTYIYPTEMGRYIHQKICISTFIAPLFIVASNQKLPKYLSVVE